MAKKLGNDYRLWIEGATPDSFAEVKGNQDLRIARAGQTTDTSTKDDFPYGSAAPGLRTVTITAGFVPNLPDVNGFTRLEGLANAPVATTGRIQVRKGGSAGATGDVVFDCLIYVTNYDTDFGQNAPVGTPFTFVNAAPPTVDTLS